MSAFHVLPWFWLDVVAQVPFKEALAKYADTKILRFRNLTDLFGGITDPKLKESFDEFVNKVTSNW